MKFLLNFAVSSSRLNVGFALGEGLVLVLLLVLDVVPKGLPELWPVPVSVRLPVCRTVGYHFCPGYSRVSRTCGTPPPPVNLPVFTHPIRDLPTHPPEFSCIGEKCISKVKQLFHISIWIL